MKRTILLLVGAAFALVIATAGTAGVQALITGAQIKDGTIESRDIENRTIGRVDIAAATLSSLRGARGPVGVRGPRGAVGPQGAAGAQGAAGPQGATGAQGPQGIPGTTGAPGADGGLAGYEIVTGTPVAIDGSAFNVPVSVTCPAGKLATGGGVAVGNPALGVVMVDSRPTALGAGWAVTVANFDDQANTATPYAVCANSA